MDCIRQTVPARVDVSEITGEECTEESLYEQVGFTEVDDSEIDNNRRNVMYRRYTVIAGILPFVGDDHMRNVLMDRLAEENGITKKTVRIHLCKYLALSNTQALLPKARNTERELTKDEKNIRWALNKFYYTRDPISVRRNPFESSAEL